LFISGKISFLEFSEQMEKENQVPDAVTDTGLEDVQGIEDVMDTGEFSKDDQDKDKSKYV
jgi:hypothetical protein